MPVKARLGFVLVCIFLDALGIGLIVPVLPRLIGTLTENRDAQTWWYGAIMLSYGLMQFAGAPFLGALSDRIGRRPVLLGGILGLGLMFAVPAFTSSLVLILLSRLIGGMLSANMSVAQAYVADISTGFTRVGYFGKIGATFGIGFVLGPALGGILGQDDPHLPFLVASALTLLNFLYGAFVLPESLAVRESTPLSFKKHNPLAALRRLIRITAVRNTVLLWALSALANSLLQCTWALYTEYRYGFTPLAIGLSIFALGLAISAMQGVLLPRILLRVPERRIILCAACGGAACLLGIALSTQGTLSAVLCCFYAVSSLIGPLVTSAVSRIAPAQEQGSAIGALSSINSLMGAIAPALGTPLLMLSAEHLTDFAAGTPYFVAALLLALGLGLYLAGAREN